MWRLRATTRSCGWSYKSCVFSFLGNMMKDLRMLKVDLDFLIEEYNRLADFVLKKFPEEPGLLIDIVIRKLDQLPSAAKQKEEDKIEQVTNETTYQYELEDQLEWFKDNAQQVMAEIRKDLDAKET